MARPTIDLVGQTFGRWTVLERVEHPGRGARWRCQCSCGTVSVVISGSLRSGGSTSCGCHRKERISAARLKDLVGQRFGRLLVLERAGSTKDSKPTWRCLCDCGNETVAQGSSLRRHMTRSCGCLQKEAAKEQQHKMSQQNIREDSEYSAAHWRIYQLRGPANLQDCRHCPNSAAHWAYDHIDPDELVSNEETRFGLTYSLKPEHYIPLCVSCHRKLDRKVTSHD